MLGRIAVHLRRLGAHAGLEDRHRLRRQWRSGGECDVGGEPRRFLQQRQDVLSARDHPVVDLRTEEDRLLDASAGEELVHAVVLERLVRRTDALPGTCCSACGRDQCRHRMSPVRPATIPRAAVSGQALGKAPKFITLARPSVPAPRPRTGVLELMLLNTIS